MAKRIDRRFLRQPEPEKPPEEAKPVAAPVLPEPNARADSLRSWGNGIMTLFFLNAALTAVGGVIALGNEELGGLRIAIWFFAIAFSAVVCGFWVRDLHHAAADGLDGLAEAVRRVRRN